MLVVFQNKMICKKADPKIGVKESRKDIYMPYCILVSFL